MAQLSKPAIPAKMYRHFAIVTVALTACLALFAHSENAQIAAQPATHTTPTPSARTTPVPAYGRADFRYGDNVEQGNGFQEYEEYAPGVGQSSVNSSTFIASAPAPGSDIAGFSQAYLNSLSEEELAQLQREMANSGFGTPAQRQRALAAMVSASRRRTGSGTGPDE